MTEILPEGTDLRKAVKWISEMRTDDPKKKLSDLIVEASVKFDLSPKDEVFLFDFYSR